MLPSVLFCDEGMLGDVSRGFGLCMTMMEAVDTNRRLLLSDRVVDQIFLLLILSAVMKARWA